MFVCVCMCACFIVETNYQSVLISISDQLAGPSAYHPCRHTSCLRPAWYLLRSDIVTHVHAQGQAHAHRHTHTNSQRQPEQLYRGAESQDESLLPTQEALTEREGYYKKVCVAVWSEHSQTVCVCVYVFVQC